MGYSLVPQSDWVEHHGRFDREVRIDGLGATLSVYQDGEAYGVFISSPWTEREFLSVRYFSQGHDGTRVRVYKDTGKAAMLVDHRHLFNSDDLPASLREGLGHLVTELERLCKSAA